ncbi:MAG: bifunctional hydroxymethylpyrimidine kinase/phosphomethylpyrimidine kinase [Caulobacteraceae bacterium]
MAEQRSLGRVLAIGGSDNVGGAGVQADIKTVTALGGYAMTAITAITAQDTRSVAVIRPVFGPLIEAQGRCAIEDIGVDAIKTGMLPTAAAVAAAERIAQLAPDAPLIVDPVFVSSSGAPLFGARAVAALERRLLPRADLFTPNSREASALTGVDINTADDLRRAGEILLRRGARAALMKGGHLSGSGVVDILMSGAGEHAFPRRRIETRNTRGTGCTLASACAVGLAQGLALVESVERAIEFVARAIEAAPNLGTGDGPLDHAWALHG